MRRTFLKLLIGLMAVLPLTGAVAAENNQAPVLSRIADSGILRVGMSAGQPPFNVTNRDGKVIGMDVDLAGLLAASLGVKLDIIEMPFADLLPALEGGDVDLVISGMTATLQRNMRAAFVGPYHLSGKSILARSETIAALQSEGLNKDSLKIAALRGSTSEDFVKLRAPEAQLTATDTYDTAIDLLLSNKVDLFVADVSIVQLSQLRWPDAGLVSASKPLTIEPIGVAVPAGDPLMLNLVENYVDALIASGTMERLRKKWFESGAWLMQLP